MTVNTHIFFLALVLKAFSSEGSFTCHTYCETDFKPERNLSRDSEIMENLQGNSEIPQYNKKFRKHKEPDVYNGENTEWPDYLCHFEQVSMWNDWTDTEKATQLAMSLRGRAQRVLSELSIREMNNYSELKCALTQRFSPHEHETAYRCDFRTRRRKPNELNRIWLLAKTTS